MFTVPKFFIFFFEIMRYMNHWSGNKYMKVGRTLTKLLIMLIPPTKDLVKAQQTEIERSLTNSFCEKYFKTGIRNR